MATIGEEEVSMWDDDDGVRRLGMVAAVVLFVLGVLGLSWRPKARFAEALPTPQVDKVDLTVDKADVVGTVVAWKGFQKSFQLYQVQLQDGSSVLAISGDGGYRYETYRVNLKGLGWRDSAGNEIHVITGSR